MRAPLAAVGPAFAFLAAFLAGCAADPVATEAVPVQQPAAAPRFLDWSQLDCESMSWSVPVLASSLQPYLPDGFQPAEPGTGSPLAAGQAATLGFRSVECSEGFGEGDLLHSIQSGAVFTPVLPPAELRDDRFGARITFGWDVLVTSREWRADAGAWGLPLHDGGALVGPTAQGWTAGLAMDRVGAFDVSGRSVGDAATAADHETRMITLAAEGFALWDAAVEEVVVSTGAGAWTVNPESWVADVLGSTQGAATFELATWTAPYATVHWPGEALGPVDQDEGPFGEPDVPDLPLVLA